MPEKNTQSFELLPYRILAQRWMSLAVLLIIIGTGLWISTGFLDLPVEEFRPIAIGLLSLGIILAGYCLLARKARVVCQKTRMVIFTPLYPIAISYQRIRTIRSTEFKRVFPMDKQSRGRVKRYQQLWPLTVPVVELKGFPYPRWYLRMWMHRFILVPNMTAVVLPVADWMMLTRKLDTLRSAVQTRKRADKDDFYGS